MIRIRYSLIIALLVFLAGCHSKTQERNDKVYSRHLQKYIALTVISTPVPKVKGDFNLLLLNDGQDVEKMRVKQIMDSLNKKKLIQPLLVVAIHAFNRVNEYGVTGNPDYRGNGAAAEKYGNFIINELLPFVKKQSGVRKFHSVSLAGHTLGGLSAFDVAWDHADKIDNVGVFSGAFGYTDKDVSDTGFSDEKNRIIINKIKSSRKRPHLKYWFYTGGDEEITDRDNDGTIDVIDDTRDLVDLIKKKKVCPPEDISYTEVKDGRDDYASWSHVFPQFLLWFAGK